CTIASITFGIGRSGAGTTKSEWRGSLDGFAGAINNYSTVNGGLSNNNGILTNPDQNSGWTGNVLDLEELYVDIDEQVTFRLYLYEAEANTGTAGLQGNLTIEGTYEEVLVEDPPVVTGEEWNGFVGYEFSQFIPATNNPAAFAVTDGDLPSGLELNEETGEISGTPTSTGVYAFEVTATNDFGDGSGNFVITVTALIPVVTEEEWNGFVGLAFNNS